MSTTQPNVVDSILAFIKERRDALNDLEVAIMKTRELFGQPLTAAIGAGPSVSEPRALSAAEVVVRRKPGHKAKRAVGRKIKRAPGRPIRTVPPDHVAKTDKSPRLGGKRRVDHAAVQQAVVAYLDRQKAPTTMAAIVAAVKSYPPHVRPIIDRLVDAGTVIRIGIKAHQRIGYPSVMGSPIETTRPLSEAKAQAEAPPAPVRETVPTAVGASGAADLRLAAEINRVLKSGASYDPREVRRNIAGAFPMIDLADVTSALERMVGGGRVERIPLGSQTRYRQLGKSRDEAIA